MNSINSRNSVNSVNSVNTVNSVNSVQTVYTAGLLPFLMVFSSIEYLITGKDKTYKVCLVEISKNEEVAMRELFVTLRAILTEHFPNVKMALFGSYPR